jgi:hypothetical protein
MNAWRYILVLAAAIAVGFAASSAKKVERAKIEALKNEGNRRIIQAEQSKKELNQRYGINLTPLQETVPASVRAREFDWSKFSAGQRRVILKKLFAHVANVGRIFEICEHEGIRMDGGAGNLRKSSDTAWLFYLSAKDFQSKNQLANR